MKINLSYVIVTRNKLDYLKMALESLLKHLKDDEELIIIDGASTDGTVAYIESFYKKGLINVFISEPDKGEAHGCNKGILMAKGELIKLISDDDVFDYNSIRLCKDFMLQNTDVQVINTNGGWVNLSNFNGVTEFTKIYEVFFVNKWVSENHPFSHCALGLLFRKDALSLLGFFRVGFIRADAEYTLRVTASRVNFVWFTGVTYVRILNESSNSNKFNQKIENETRQLNAFYGFDIDRIYDAVNKSGKKETGVVRKVLRRSKYHLKNLLGLPANNHKNKKEVQSVAIDFNEAQKISLQWLEEVNKRETDFLN